MTRAISPHGKYELQLIEAPVKRGLDQSGNVVEYAESKPINAQFAMTGLTEYEQLAALEHFSFSGLPEGVNPLSTVAVWDSEAEGIRQGWSPEMQEQIDKRLRHLATMNPASCLVVDPPEKSSPWKKYDEQSIATIFRLFSETGAEPEVVRLYEFENQGRPEIIAACEAIAEGRATVEDFVEKYPELGIAQFIEEKKTPAVSVFPGLVSEGVAGTEQVAPARVEPVPPVTDVTFPVNTSPGRWTLSNGDKIQGKKVDAEAAEAALHVLPALPEAVIVNA